MRVTLLIVSVEEAGTSAELFETANAAMEIATMILNITHPLRLTGDPSRYRNPKR
jgi:hypothetical protein